MQDVLNDDQEEFWNQCLLVYFYENYSFYNENECLDVGLAQKIGALKLSSCMSSCIGPIQHVATIDIPNLASSCQYPFCTLLLNRRS